MGKVKKPKPSRRAKNVSEEETFELEAQGTSDSKDNAIQTILDQLQVSKHFKIRAGESNWRRQVVLAL